MNLNDTEKDLLVFIYNLVKDPNPEFICLNLEGMVFYENVEYKILYDKALDSLIELDYIYDNFDSPGEFFMSPEGKKEAAKLGERTHEGIVHDENRKLSNMEKEFQLLLFKERYENLEKLFNETSSGLKFGSEFEWKHIKYK